MLGSYSNFLSLTGHVQSSSQSQVMFFCAAIGFSGIIDLNAHAFASLQGTLRSMPIDLRGCTNARLETFVMDDAQYVMKVLILREAGSNCS